MRIFLSSTYQDLVDEREAVYERLRLEGHTVVRMEDFGSRGTVPLETCLEALETCECYVLLLGSRYGSLAPTYNLSYTHVEYERARELDLWVMAYVRDGIRDASDDNGDDRVRLLDFLEIVERSHTIRRPYFASPEELAEQVAQDLVRLSEWLPVRPSFGHPVRAIQNARPYAGRTVRQTRLKLNPLVVVVADLSVMEVDGYPEGGGRRMREKVRSIIDFLEREGVSAVVFNEIPAPGSEPLVAQRIGEVRARADIIVALIHGKSDARKLQTFVGVNARVAAWFPDHVAEPQVEGVRLAPYTQEQLQQCGLALNVQRYLDAVIDDHVAASLS
jgi:hypothetical protein